MIVIFILLIIIIIIIVIILRVKVIYGGNNNMYEYLPLKSKLVLKQDDIFDALTKKFNAKKPIIYTNKYDCNDKYDLLFANDYNNNIWELLLENGYLILNDKVLIQQQDSIYYGVIFHSDKPYFIWKKHKLDLDTVHIQKLEENVYVMRDDLLAGGTKSRAYKSIENVIESELVYAGPNIGFAQVALPSMCKLYNKKATVFIESLTNISYRALMMGANIKLCKNANLKTLQSNAEKYKNKDRFIVPFGLDNELFIDALYENLSKNWKTNIIPDIIWCVSGSATLLKVLYRLFPKAQFNVVQVGKKIWDDQLQLDRTKLFITPQKFWESADNLPPYPSIPQYDAKVWQFFKAEKKKINLIWNVGSDVIDFTQ